MFNKKNRVFLSAITGNILEYYDFTVFTVFAAEIGSAFFPPDSEPIVKVLYTLAVFAVGFITRPIGGIFFGYIGDNYGRRISLITSMVGMTIPTFAIGMLPGYSAIGIYAPILLILMRLIQGLCISGEGTGAAIFVLEHFHNLKAGFITSVVQGSNIAGTLIASFIGLICHKYLGEVESSWRVAFVIGGFFGICGFYLRLKVSETPIFIIIARKRKNTKSRFSEVVRSAGKYMFITFLTGGMASSIVYLVKSYVNVFYLNKMMLDPVTSLYYLFYTSFVLMIFMPLFGALSDYVGKKKLMIFTSFAVFCFAYPVLRMMSSTNTLEQMIALSLLGILAASVSGVSYIFVISLFKPEERFFGVAFSYNLGIALFGGTSPIISTWLVTKTGLYFAPAFYIMFTSATFLFLLFAVLGKEYLKDESLLHD